MRWLLAFGLLVATVLTIVIIDRQSQGSSPPSSLLPPSSSTGPGPDHAAQGGGRGPVGPADGVVPDDVTVYDDGIPAVAKLDESLRDALREAADDAGDDDVDFYVNSGWRSPDYQNQLLREAVAKYGSKDEAARWVATPATSPHVAGDAVDIGDSDAQEWLSEHGAAYGLCQIYRNEPWHYELRGHASDRGCPRMYADPTEDPRTRQ
ncbi:MULTISPECIES: M15 family metallopeptidase [Streptomyces]|uniref:Peptidase M15 n=1 Tax=Streptomyces alboflavus TaxID=67267 RepID=A0A1Z1WFI2_9ACTN|nr:M15 family metallopeptidase [Streptomyces alboflavus]ARX85213.1 peptidase M15 [Streptomyces alboflavus]